MTGAMREQPLALLPELVLLLGALAGLALGMVVPRERQWVSRVVVVAALLLAASVSVVVAVLGSWVGTFYATSWTVDVATTVIRVAAPTAAALTLLLGAGRLRGDRREAEFGVLVVMATLGAVLLAGASDLLVLAVAYLLATVPLYALAGWGRDARGAEAALKLYLLGALVGVLLLLGAAVLMGAGGGGSAYADLAAGLPSGPRAAAALGVVTVLAALLFKAGAVPVHFWVPDAAEGATVPAAAFLTTVPKLGALVAAYRLLVAIPDTVVDWRLLLAIVAAATMTLGNLGALAQRSPTRLLGYSTVSQVGYLLMAVVVGGRDGAEAALLVYLVAYAVTNLAAFAVVAALPAYRTLDAYRGLAQHRPGLVAVLLVSLLGLVGTPPTAVFVGKLSVFTSAWDGGMAWLVVVAAVNTVVSLAYYLRWVAPCFRSGAAGAEPVERRARQAAVLAAAGVLAWGLLAGPVVALVPPLTG